MWDTDMDAYLLEQPWGLWGDTWNEEKAIFTVEICESGGKGGGGSPLGSY